MLNYTINVWSTRIAQENGVFLDKRNKSGLGEQSLSPAAQIQSHHAALKLQPVYKLKQTPARHAKQAKASVETRAAIFS
jgi:hypothetical protein